MTTLARINPETVAELEPVLESLVKEHELLLALAGEHRTAISTADPECLSDVIERTNESVQRIAELEERRRRVLGVQQGSRRPGASPTVTELAALAGGPEGDRLLEVSDRLKDRIEKVRGAQASVREASKSLVVHMRGIVQQVGARLSHAGTYSPSGRVDPGRQQVTSGIDVKS